MGAGADNLLGVLADPVRVRILALASVDELCVGDLALVLKISMDQSSSPRDGRVINYRLAEGFPHQLLVRCLHELLNIANQRQRDDQLDA